MRYAAALLTLAFIQLSAYADETAPEPTRRFMFNVKLGPSFSLTASYYTIVPQLDFGVAVTPDRKGYVVFAPQVETGVDVAVLMLPVGFQYDFRLPVRGLYLYPCLVAGYAVVLFGSAISTIHLGVVVPEAGVKYVIHDRWTVGIEPFSLPVFFSSTKANVEYRFSVYGGVVF